MAPRRSILVSLLAPLLPLLSMAGCATTVTDDYTLDFPITAQAVALDVSNFRGSVEVRVDPDMDTFRIESDTTVRHELDKSDLPEKQDAVSVLATVELQHGRAVLRVRSDTRRPGKDDQKVNIFVRMPRCDGLRIDNAYGMVELVDVRGAVQVTNRQGHVELRTSHPMTDPVTITTVNGNIYYQVPPGSSGTFDLQSLEGEVRFVDRVGGTGQVYEVERGHYQGTLNEGRNPVVCRTNSGRVMAWVIEDPVALTRVWHSRGPDARDVLFLKGSRRYTRNLPDDHPEVRSDTRSDHQR